MVRSVCHHQEVLRDQTQTLRKTRQNSLLELNPDSVWQRCVSRSRHRPLLTDSSSIVSLEHPLHQPKSSNKYPAHNERLRRHSDTWTQCQVKIAYRRSAEHLIADTKQTHRAIWPSFLLHGPQNSVRPCPRGRTVRKRFKGFQMISRFSILGMKGRRCRQGVGKGLLGLLGRTTRARKTRSVAVDTAFSHSLRNRSFAKSVLLL